MFHMQAAVAAADIILVALAGGMVAELLLQPVAQVMEEVKLSLALQVQTILAVAVAVAAMVVMAARQVAPELQLLNIQIHMQPQQ
jgi:hypothetical protein